MKIRGIREYLESLRSRRVRSLVIQAAKRRGCRGGMNPENREGLAHAVFEVMDDMEHRHGYQHPTVITLRNIMNRIFDDLGWNENSKQTLIINNDTDRMVA